MVTKESKIEEMCSFFVSDFHFEMIILPYINKKIGENYNIQIVSQNKLRDSVKVLLKKINLDEESKNKILKLNWNNSNLIVPNDNVKTIIFVKGKEKFINMNNEILKREKHKGEIIVINCYDLEEIEHKMQEINKRYTKILNILGEKEF